MRAGLPSDPAPWLALALALVALLAGARLVRRDRRGSCATSLAAAPPDAAPLAAAPPDAAPPGATSRGAPTGAVAGLALAIAAGALSAGYVAFYLRGGPRIIDATSYWLEARAIAAGHLAWPLDEPATAVLGRFLVRSSAAVDAAAAPDADQVAVIFPPGFPAVLSLGFLVGAPLAIGPLLAAAITLATFDLAARFEPPRPPVEGAPRLPFVPLLAALFSTLCAALRYHTADTMSHGLSALCFTVALSFTLRALDGAAAGVPAGWLGPGVRAAGLAGLAAGWLAATRPPSALALAATLLLVLLWSAPAGPHGAAPPRARLRVAAAMALGALPGLALLLSHQRAATGAFASSQGAYYAVSDGPPGCFRYGFGDGIGCLGEHGDFVRHHLASGYGFLAAAGTTLRRLKLHLVDALNAEPLAVLVIAGAVIALRTPRARVLPIAVLLQVAAYTPFYFDGNYPGGGARFFADVLPIEHVLAALAFAAVAARPSARRPLPWALVAAALPLAGFAFRAGFEHAALRDREGGLPMFDAAELARTGVTRGLVFVDTDHGFNLGFDPGPSEIEVLRYHGDALDRMAWEARGRPPAFRYRFAIPDRGTASISITPLLLGPPRRDEEIIEGESLWPPLDQRGAWALPEHAGGTCASGSRLLAVHQAMRGDASVTAARGDTAVTAARGDTAVTAARRDASVTAARGDALVRVGLPARWLRGSRLAPRVAVQGDVAGEVRLLVDGAEIHRWPIAPASSERPGAPLACIDLPPYPVPEQAARIELVLARWTAAPRQDVTGKMPYPPANPGQYAATTDDFIHPRSAGLFALDALSIRGGNSVDR